MTKPVIALLGTGYMGGPMARNLLKGGYVLKVWNRSLDKAEPLAENGAEVFGKAQSAVQGADIIITMLTDGEAVSEVLFTQGVAGTLKPGAIIIDMSSIKPAQAREHAAKLEAIGLRHFDAPVSGGTKGAEAGTLAIMVGGDEGDFETVKPVFACMGRAVRVGPHGAGQLAKLANQAIVGTTIGVVAEALLLAKQGGADPDAIRDALKGGFADSIILQQHGGRMTSGNFEPGALSKIQLKDLNNILEEAGHLDITLPLAEHMQARYARLVDELDGGGKDHSGIYLELKDRNGL
jgi:3-hydroxyisobutyrate dehydrogenase-like beta-hydroxyacid dehydrogenase